MFSTWAFWVLALSGIALVRLLPDAAARARAIVLATIGFVGVAAVLKLPAWSMVLLAACVAWLVIAIRFVRGSSQRGALIMSLAIVGPIAALWAAGKHAAAEQWPLASFLFYFAGTSFLLVKAWTLAKDFCDGRLPAYDPVIGAAYFLHLPTYLSGPMHYYGEFESSLARPVPLTTEETVDDMLRLLWGMVKVSLLSPLLHPLSLLALSEVPQPTAWQLVCGSFGYSLVLYLDFSGYTDMAIATSRLLGVAAPENFRTPLLAVNIRDFWQRWHITFTRVLTAYIFVPLSRVLQRRRVSPRATMIVGYLAAFGFAGYWHGPTSNFIVWGLYHAAGLIIYDLYRGWRLGRKRGAVAPGAVHMAAARVLAVASTLSFVSLGWIFFVFPLDVLWGWFKP